MAGPVEDRLAGAARAKMVERLRANGRGNPAVLAAMSRVPRHRFVDRVWVRTAGSALDDLTARQQGEPGFLELAYHPARSLLIRIVDGQPTSAASAPNLMADMLAMAHLAPGTRLPPGSHGAESTVPSWRGT